MLGGLTMISFTSKPIQKKSNLDVLLMSELITKKGRAVLKIFILAKLHQLFRERFENKIKNNLMDV